MTYDHNLIGKYESENRKHRHVMLGSDYYSEDNGPRFLDDIVLEMPQYFQYVFWLRSLPYREYLQTEHWKNMRAAALIRYDYQCWKCGSKHNLQVHHLSYEFRGMETTEELMVLCSECHKKEHGL